MRLLLDECVPKRLRRELPGHEISTVVEMGWSGKRNGELLKLMVTNGFVGFLTVDKNLEFQQNVRASGLGVVVLVARTNRMKELRPLAPAILSALDHLKPGELVRVSAARD
jgi:predicted nuclease of predicted toxin-antitoxin system